MKHSALFSSPVVLALCAMPACSGERPDFGNFDGGISDVTLPTDGAVETTTDSGVTGSTEITSSNSDVTNGSQTTNGSEGSDSANDTVGPTASEQDATDTNSPDAGPPHETESDASGAYDSDPDTSDTDTSNAEASDASSQVDDSDATEDADSGDVTPTDSGNAATTESSDDTTDEQESSEPESDDTQSEQTGTTGSVSSEVTASTGSGDGEESTSTDPGESSTDSSEEPLACGGETYDHDGNPATACRDWSTCEPGHYVSAEGSSTTNRQCGNCGPGTFTDAQNASICADFTECQPGEFIETDGSTENDQRCDVCDAGSYSEDTNSEACTDCPDGTFSELDGAQECIPWSVCGWAETHDEDGTATTDTTCGVGSPYRQVGTSGWDDTQAVAVDEDANVYIVGKPGGDIDQDSESLGNVFLRKYDASGTPLWTRQFGATAPTGVGAMRVANGLVYIAGSAEGSISGSTADSDGSGMGYFMAYSTNGDPQWTRRFGTGGTETVTGMALDATGNVYIGGHTTGWWGVVNAQKPGGTDYFVRKYNSGGVYQDMFEDGTADADFVGGIAIDSTGAIYVGGYTYGVIYENEAVAGADAFIHKISTSLDHIWITQFGSDQTDIVTDIALDGSGNPIVVGYTDGVIAGSHDGDAYDAFVIKYSGANAFQWERQFTSPDDFSETVTSVIIDDGGFIYVGGYTDGDLQGSNSGSTDAFVRRLNSSGDSPATVQFGTADVERLYALGLGADGEVFGGGYTSGALVGTSASDADAFVALIEF